MPDTVAPLLDAGFYRDVVAAVERGMRVSLETGRQGCREVFLSLAEENDLQDEDWGVLLFSLIEFIRHRGQQPQGVA
jgi:hypothetical protein